MVVADLQLLATERRDYRQQQCHQPKLDASKWLMKEFLHGLFPLDG
jgi:hypothetical protein